MSIPALPPAILALISQLIRQAGLALSAAGPAPAPEVSRRILKWMIAPAEAMMRRCLWIIAAALPVMLLPAPREREAEGRDPSAPGSPASARSPRFRLGEPRRQPRMPGAAPASTAAATDRAAPDPALIAERVRRRLAALLALQRNIKSETLRLARLAARGRPPHLAASLEDAPGGRTPELAPEARAAFAALCLQASVAAAHLCGPPMPANTS
ncbi:hypothetical protein [Hyphomonas sp.]|uniref:hypothetical protein n=1 Tax=Hyphomonas sp. TaxID=87 RepID=UPI00391B57BE